MIFSSLVALIEKDLKLFFRSKISSAFIILMPLLIVLLAGYGFGSNNLSGISVATYSDSYSEVTENILFGFEKNDFIIKRYNSLEDCENSVKISENQICVFFPANLSYEGSEEKVIFYVDYSRTNLAYTLINLVGEEVSSESSNLGAFLVQDLIDNINQFKSSLSEEKTKLSSVPQGLQEIESLTENIETPIKNLEGIISELEDYGNASEIQAEISDLESVQINLSTNLKKLDSENQELQSDLASVLSGLNSLVNSLSSLDVGNAEDMVSPIEISLEFITPVSEKKDYLVPTVIALISLFGAILISSTFVLKDKKTLAYFRNFVTPTWDFTFILSTYLTCLIILFLQFLFVFLGLYFLFDMNFFIMPFEIISVLILSWSAFIFIGMFLGYVFKSEETIIFSAVLTASVLMFFSSLILPLENISGNLLKIASYNPFVILENSLKKIYLFGLGFDVLGRGLCILGGFFVVGMLFTYLMRKATKRVL